MRVKEVGEHQITQVEDMLYSALFETRVPSLSHVKNAEKKIADALRMLKFIRER